MFQYWQLLANFLQRNSRKLGRDNRFLLASLGENAAPGIDNQRMPIAGQARVMLAALIMGLVTFGFGLLNVPGIVLSIFVGLLLIIVIALPIIWQRYFWVLKK